MSQILKYVLLVLSFCFINGAIAQEATWAQKNFLFTIPDEPGNTLPNAEEECRDRLAKLKARGISGIEPHIFGKFKIFRSRTAPINGRVINNSVNEIGEILICQDWQNYSDQNNKVPVFFEILINDRRYGAVGGVEYSEAAEIVSVPGGGTVMSVQGYPQRGLAYLTYTGIVLPAAPGGRGGTITMSNLAFVDGGLPRALIDHSSHFVLSVWQPLN